MWSLQLHGRHRFWRLSNLAAGRVSSVWAGCGCGRCGYGSGSRMNLNESFYRWFFFRCVGITEIVRGEDLLLSTARQILIRRALFDSSGTFILSVLFLLLLSLLVLLLLDSAAASDEFTWSIKLNIPLRFFYDINILFGNIQYKLRLQYDCL